MQEFIATEKARIQSLFDGFNNTGSWMEMRERDSSPLRFGLIDSFTVTRVAPHFDAAGKLTRTDFWLLFKSVGYNNGWQYAHTIKVVGWSHDDSYLLDLADVGGRRYHIELIMDVSEPEMTPAWRAWQRYKAENQQLFEQVDAQLLEEHVKIAETWE